VIDRPRGDRSDKSEVKREVSQNAGSVEKRRQNTSYFLAAMTDDYARLRAQASGLGEHFLLTVVGGED
jgi:hypothetical protein